MARHPKPRPRQGHAANRATAATEKTTKGKSAKPDRWYRDGLQFECTQCGDCCTGAPGYVWVTYRETEALARFLQMSNATFRKRYVRKIGRRYSLTERANSDCVFFNQGCTVYPARPKQCRTFPFWPENLSSRKAWEELEGQCPGARAGQGKIYPLEEIELIRRGGSEASRCKKWS
jgi:Fe-S-cluster containining protein